MKFNNDLHSIYIFSGIVNNPEKKVSEKVYLGYMPITVEFYM